MCPPCRGPTPTAEAVFFSFLWRVHSPFETSSSVVVPSWEPQAMKHPLSCTRRQKRASSQTCRRARQSHVALRLPGHLVLGEA